MEPLFLLALVPLGLFAVADLFNGGGSDGDDAPRPVDTTPRVVDGGDQADALNGADGDDALMGGLGADTLLGGAGDDRLLGSHLKDGQGAADIPRDPPPNGLDVPNGNYDGAADLLDGGAGDDTLYGDSGADGAPDTLLGGAGNDLIVDVPTLVATDTGWHTTPDGPAVIDAGQGDDTILGSAGDTITTGDGADVIHLGSTYGRDLDSSLGSGLSSIPLALDGKVTVIDFTPGVDRLEIDAAAINTIQRSEGVSYDRTSYTGYEVVLREENGQTIVSIGQPGGAYHDAMVLEGVTGLGKNDILLTLPPSVAAGDTRGDASVSADDLTGTSGADHLDGALGNDTLSSLMRGPYGPTDDGQADTLTGGWDEDVLIGTGGDVLDGGKGDDIIVHVAAADGADAPGATLIGGEGHDLIYASGHDIIDLGGGSNEMDGLVLADPRLCTTEDLLNTHLVVRNFGPDPDIEFGDFIFVDLSREAVVIDPVTGAQTTVTITLTPQLREVGGHSVISLKDEATGKVYDNVITLEGVTGLTVEEVIGEPNTFRPLRLPVIDAVA